MVFVSRDMKGSIRKQGRESFQIIVDMGKGPDGRRLRHYETVKVKKAGDARKRLTEVLSGLDHQTFIPPTKRTVAEHLNAWLAGYVATNTSPTTQEWYRSICNLHLVPALGHFRLTGLTAQTIQEFYAESCKNWARRTVLHWHRTLSEALDNAVTQGLIYRNPASLTDPPSPPHRDPRSLTVAEAEAVVNKAAGSYIFPVVYVGLNCGLREAELLALAWKDVDLVMMTITVSRTLYKRHGECYFKEPKSSHSRRRVAMTPRLALFLRKYREDQETWAKQLDRVLTADDLVFPAIGGGPMNPSTLSHAFKKIARELGLEDVSFHTLRHTFASLSLYRGANIKAVSEAMGHYSSAFTMDVYQSVLKGMQEEAMSRLNEVIPDVPKNVADLSRNPE